MNILQIGHLKDDPSCAIRGQNRDASCRVALPLEILRQSAPCRFAGVRTFRPVQVPLGIDGDLLARFTVELARLVGRDEGGDLVFRGFSDPDAGFPVGELILGRTTVLFEGRFVYHPYGSYDVTPDGQRFVLIDDSEAEPAPTHLVLVQNFSEVLKRLVPPK